MTWAKAIGALALSVSFLMPCANAQVSSAETNGPSTFVRIDAGIESSATEDAQLGVEVERIVFYDLAAPIDGAELTDLGGYGVALVTALSHDNIELPLARVYIELDGKEIPLTLLAAPRTRTQLSVRTQRVYGANRWQGLYLFPIYALQDGAVLKADFAANRIGFSLGQLASATQDRLGYGRRLSAMPSMEEPPDAPLMILINREFPGALTK